MDECPTGGCQMRRDLENAADPLAFFADNYPIPSILDNLDNLSEQELRCAACMLCTAFLKISHKRTFWEKLIR